MLKEGTQYEDAALLNALKDIISLIDSQQGYLSRAEFIRFKITFHFLII